MPENQIKSHIVYIYWTMVTSGGYQENPADPYNRDGFSLGGLNFWTGAKIKVKLKIRDTSCSVMVTKFKEQTITSEFDSHWVVHTFELVL